MSETNTHIRSFVLRQGRFSNAQRRAFETLLPQYGIEFKPSLIDLNTIFGRPAPKILEIGFGMGETTTAIALQHPEIDYLGVEVHTPGVGGLLKLIEQNHLGNVRIIQHDALEVLHHMIGPCSLDGIHIYFPDPWPKKKHHKRRLLQPPFVHLITQKLKPRGYLHCATDWHAYAEQMLEVLQGETALKNTAKDFAPRPAFRPLTKFEQRGIKLGHGVWDLMFERTQEILT